LNELSEGARPVWTGVNHSRRCLSVLSSGIRVQDVLVRLQSFTADLQPFTCARGGFSHGVVLVDTYCHSPMQ